MKARHHVDPGMAGIIGALEGEIGILRTLVIGCLANAPREVLADSVLAFAQGFGPSLPVRPSDREDLQRAVEERAALALEMLRNVRRYAAYG